MIVEIRIYIKTATAYTAEDIAEEIRHRFPDAKIEIINHYLTWKDVEFNRLYE